MPRRSVWNGAISFGMVAIPVKLYPATRSKDISFVTLHAKCQQRIRQQRWCETDNEIVELKDTVKGYEVSKGTFVVMEPHDFDGLPVDSTHTIEISEFVEQAEIDPIYYDKCYVLEPQQVGQKPYFLLKQALESTDRVAIGKISIRQKEHMCVIRPFGEGIAMSTMFYPDEILALEELEIDEEEIDIAEAEADMAETLVDQLSAAWAPGERRDEYREALEAIIEAKLTNTEPVKAESATSVGKPGDLMAALKASIDASKTNGTEPEKPAAKKTPAKKATAKKAPAKRKSRAKVGSAK